MQGNILTNAAIRRMAAHLKAQPVVENYREVGKYKVVRFGKLSLRMPVAPDHWYKVDVTTQLQRECIRSWARGLGKPCWTGGDFLDMASNFAEWEPSTLKLNYDDAKYMTKLALDGSYLEHGEPNWRLYGAGIIDTEIENSEHVYFRISLSDLGLKLLLEFANKTLEMIREDREAARAKEQAEKAKRFVMTSEPYRDSADQLVIDFTFPLLPGVTITFNLSTKKLYVIGVLSDWDIRFFSGSSKFAAFMKGVDQIVNFSNLPAHMYYYDTETNQVLKKERS